MASNHPTEPEFGDSRDFSKILTNPFLDIAARCWEKPRYEAFRVRYRSMRLIDDQVDNRRVAGAPISESEVARYRETMLGWLDQVRNRTATGPIETDLMSTTDRFAIPFWPWERLCRAMIFDMEHDGFQNLRVFLRYAEGAAIAPASVFTHLCGVQEGRGGRYSPPDYDIRDVARPLALFSYLVHIIRDFQKDQLRGLNYFADDFLAAQSLSRADLRQAAESGNIPERLRDLIGQYQAIADYYRKKARRALDDFATGLTPRYQLSLEIIYGLYHLVFERIDPTTGQFTEEELNPRIQEVEGRLEQIVSEFKANKGL